MAAFQFGFQFEGDDGEQNLSNEISTRFRENDNKDLTSISISNNGSEEVRPFRKWGLSEWFDNTDCGIDVKTIESWKYEYVPISRKSTSLSDTDIAAPLKKFIFSSQNYHNHNLSITKRLEKENTDLIPGEYEGGAKVWECSLDLCSYLMSQLSLENNYGTQKLPVKKILSSSNTSGVKIWEIGCGHGLPACLLYRYVLLHNKTNENTISLRRILLSDYNDFVLNQITCPNIILNTPDHHDQPFPQRINNTEKGNSIYNEDIVQFVSGDWMDLSALLSSSKSTSCNNNNATFNSPEIGNTGKFRNRGIYNEVECYFDLILAAETTYTPLAAQQTAILLSRHLTPKTGIGLVASKRFYFGVGGGTDAFKQAAQSIPGLVVTNIEEYDSGMANIRDLLQITFHPP